MKKSKLFIIYFIFLMPAILLTGCAGKSSLPTAPSDGNIIFYYGDTCPHCKIVEQYISDNKINEKLKFQTKEVYNNKDNAQDLLGKATSCGLKQDEIGVPFLWTGSTCVIGQDEIINFFKEKTNA
jgi:glutaredoxin